MKIEDKGILADDLLQLSDTVVGTRESETGKPNTNIKVSEIKKAVYKPLVEGMMTGDVIDLDCDGKNFFDIYLNRDVTRINLPTNVINGEIYRVQIRQDGTGGRAVQWGNKDTFTGNF